MQWKIITKHLTSKEFRHVMGYLNDELVPMLVQSFENLDNRLGNVEQKMVELLSKEDEPIFTQEEKSMRRQQEYGLCNQCGQYHWEPNQTNQWRVQ